MTSFFAVLLIQINFRNGKGGTMALPDKGPSFLPTVDDSQNKPYSPIPKRKVMKTVSQLFLVVVAVVTLAACGDMGKGPNKPASSSSAPTLPQ